IKIPTLKFAKSKPSDQVSTIAHSLATIETLLNLISAITKQVFHQYEHNYYNNKYNNYPDHFLFN
ncbi:hypothetical protein, partial [Rhizobium leguminosarum]|uniref:hypothetical protein n=1 Tax=Rhizobium leguminosarum TaxID=384 RepID=UPI003F985C4A